MKGYLNIVRKHNILNQKRLAKIEDSLPESSLGFRSILLQICFVNQAFLELQFFQVQGRVPG